MIRSTFSITTIASSTTMPMASTSAEQRQHVDVNAEREQPEERADDAHRHREHRDERRAPALQEEEHHQRHEHHRLEQRLHDLVNGRGDERRRVERNRRT